MKDLIIKLKGEITESNFDEWKAGVLTQIEAANKDLETDEDFAEAEHVSKKLKEAEKSLIEAKTHGLEQAADIQALFAAIDEVTEASRETRLNLDRQIKSKKEDIKINLVDDALNTARGYLDNQPDDFKAASDITITRTPFEDAIKGKRVISSMRTALSDTLVAFRDDVQAELAVIIESAKVLENIPVTHRALFQDRVALLKMHPSTLTATIEKRIAVHDKEQPEIAGEIAKAAAATEKAAQAFVTGEGLDFEAPVAGSIPPVYDGPQTQIPDNTPPSQMGGASLGSQPYKEQPAQVEPSAQEEIPDDEAFTLFIELSCPVEDAKKIAQKVNTEYGSLEAVKTINLKRS